MAASALLTSSAALLDALQAQVVVLLPLERYLVDYGLVADDLPALRLLAPLRDSERLLVSCPFHDDAGRSFEIRGGPPSHWRCWGRCDAGGTVVDLARRHEQLSAWGTLASLDARYRLALALPRGLKAGPLLDDEERRQRHRRGRLSPLACRVASS